MKKFLTIIILYATILLPPDANTADAYSKAVALINGWQLASARQFIEEEGIESPAVLGLLEFYSGNYSLSLDYLKEEENLGRHFDHIKSIVEATYEATSGFEDIETDYIIIRYSGDDKIVALYLKDIMSKALEELQDRLNWEMDEKPILEIYPDRRSFMAASTLTEEHIKVSGAVGICKFNRMMIVSPRVLQFGYKWPDTAVHELVHLFVGRISANRGVPLWLNEGFATNLEEIWTGRESQMTPSQLNHLARGLGDGEWVDLDKMKYGMPTLDDRREVGVAFAQVKSMTSKLAGLYGWGTLAEYLHRKREKGERAFEDVFEITQAEFKELWKKKIEKSGIEPVPGAEDPIYSFADDPVSSVSRWVSQTARTDLNAANRFAQRGRHDLAVRKYLDALEKDPGNSIVLHKKGRSYFEMEKYEKAVESFSGAIKRNPSYPPPYFHAAAAYIKMEEWEKAKEMLLQYTYRIPFNSAARKMLLEAASNSGDDYIVSKERQVIQILNEN